ncbi:hypothetical protein V8E52_010789 [Russula decolorans]
MNSVAPRLQPGSPTRSTLIMFPIRPTLLPTFPLTSASSHGCISVLWSPQLAGPTMAIERLPISSTTHLPAYTISTILAACPGFLISASFHWEKKVVFEAIRDLQSSTSRQLSVQVNSTDPPKRPLEDRMLDYVRVERGSEVRLPSAINKSILSFFRETVLGMTRQTARSSCTHIGAFIWRGVRGLTSGMVDRDVMMKFDIAKNEEGPLRRTLKVEMKNENNRSADKTVEGDHSVTAGRHPGLDERLKILETHLAMRYVPPPPASLIHRIKFVEDHIIQLERKYPPWAALHFNQPRRGWPPPRRPTPVIAPSHLTANPVVDPSPASSSAAAESSISPVPTTYSGKAVAEIRTKGRASRSSLHRAVLEKLEVQRAIEDLKGESEDADQTGSLLPSQHRILIDPPPSVLS